MIDQTLSRYKRKVDDLDEVDQKLLLGLVLKRPDDKDVKKLEKAIKKQ